MSDTLEFLKGKIVALYKYTRKSTREVTRDLGLSHANVARVTKRYKESGGLDAERERKCGEKLKTSEREDCHLLRISKKNPRLSSTYLDAELHDSRGITVHSSTIRRRLHEANIPTIRPVKCQLLTDRMKAQRLEWAKYCLLYTSPSPRD